MSNFKFFHISELVNRLEKVAEIERYDQVTRNIHEAYASWMKSNPDAIVISDNLKKTYSTFAGMNPESKFRDYFDDVFVKASPEERDYTTAFAKDDSFVEERSLLETVERDSISPIREASLHAVKDVVENTVSLPEYAFDGYTKIANMGDSGLANWKVSFETKSGRATIGVPVPMSEGIAYSPQSFFTSEGSAFEFDKSKLASFASSYSGRKRYSAEQSSGLTSLGNHTVLSQVDDTNNEPRESNNISLNYTIPVNDEFTANLDAVEQKVLQAIEVARSEAESTIQNSNRGDDSVTINVTLNYAGAMPDPEAPCGDVIPEGGVLAEQGIPMEEAVMGVPVHDDGGDFVGVIAFNVTNKTRTGVRVATIPVKVNGKTASAEEFFDSNGESHELNSSNLSEYLHSESEVSNEDDTDAFSDAFFASDSSLNQLRKEMKQSIDTNNLIRANACLKTIASRFGAEASQRATSDYTEWLKDATASKENPEKCKGCVFFEDPMRRNASHTVPFCNKFSSPVVQIKRGSMAPDSCEKRENRIDWDTNNDTSYNQFLGNVAHSSMEIKGYE